MLIYRYYRLYSQQKPKERETNLKTHCSKIVQRIEPSKSVCSVYFRYIQCDWLALRIVGKITHKLKTWTFFSRLICCPLSHGSQASVWLYQMWLADRFFPNALTIRQICKVSKQNNIFLHIFIFHCQIFRRNSKNDVISSVELILIVRSLEFSVFIVILGLNVPVSHMGVEEITKSKLINNSN